MSGGKRPHSISITAGNAPLQALSGKQSPTDFYPLTNSEVLAARGSEQGNTLSRSTSTSTLSVASNQSTADKWCTHCSRAVACLVLVAQQEAIKTGEDEYVFDDTGFGIGSAFEHLDIHSATSSMLSSPSTPQFDFRPHLRSKSDERNGPSIPDASPYIIFDHSHKQHNEGVFPAPSPPDQSSNTKTSQQRKTSSLEKSLADAFGSEFATDSLRKETTKPASFIPRLVSQSSGNNNNSHTHTPSLGSDVELSLLERDLAEAIATDASLPFTGSLTSTGRRLSSDLGLHPKPSLDSIRERVSRSNSERSSFSSVLSAGGSPGEVQEVAFKHENGKSRKIDEEEESDSEIDHNLAHVSDSEVAEDTSDAETQVRDKEVALEGTSDNEDNKDKDVSPGSKQTTPRSRPASSTSSRASSLSRNTADESRSENVSHQSPSASTRETSPSYSPVATSTPSLQSSGQSLDQATKDSERIHRPFYALGIHGQTPTDAYATEIEESIQKGNKASPPPATDGNDEDDNSSASESPLQESSTVLTEPSEGYVPEKVENEEESNPDQQADEVEVSPSLSSDKGNTPESSGSSPRSTGSLSNSGNEDDQDSLDDSLEDQDDDEESDDFDPQSPVSTKSFTSTLRPMSSISSMSTLTDDYLTTGSSEDDANTDHHLPRPSEALEGNTSQSLSAMTQEQRRALEQKKRRRHRRQQLVDDAKRKQEQLDRIKAQLELKRLGKIRQQVSFWEEKGVLEQRVVSVEEVEVPDLDDD
ncbi:hypothetical protein BGZ81_011311 [Podila clonocystis]|nr:hypothetical protein BGZ81_011311 [Podila clonocystis]